jgi:glutamate racemase
MTNLLEKHLSGFLKFNIDYLVLGCTHYPYLIPQIQKIIGHKIKIIDSGQAVAKQTKRILESNGLINFDSENSANQFYSNTHKEVLENLLSDYTKVSIDYLDF